MTYVENGGSNMAWLLAKTFKVSYNPYMFCSIFDIKSKRKLKLEIKKGNKRDNTYFIKSDS